MTSADAPGATVHPDSAGVSRLVAAISRLAGARSLEDVVDIVRHAARDMVDADGATFVLRSGEECYYVDEDAIEPLWRGQKFPLDACVSGYAMVHREAVFIPDIYVDDRVPQEAYRPTFVKSLAMIPVRSNLPVAAIGTYWATHHQTTTEEAALLQSLADSAAVALENVKLLRDLEDRVAERTAALEASTHDLAAFAYAAAHDLKTPLTSILGFAEIVRENDAATLSATSMRSVDAVARAARRMGTLIDQVLEYSTAASDVVFEQDVDLGGLVLEVLRDLEGLIESSGASIEVGPLPRGTVAPGLMERALQNLISNAIKYGDPQTPRVIIRGERDGPEIRVAVRDNGSGVPDEDRERIFLMFERGTHPAAGSGIGLAFARRVIDRHQGRLSVHNPTGGGAEFTITLPVS